MTIKGITFSKVDPNDKGKLDQIYNLEKESYPSDEAASYESISYRAKHATDYFLVAFENTNKNKNIIGFINGTKCYSFTHDCMDVGNHIPNASTLAIHSVVIHKSHQRRGYASQMIHYYCNAFIAHDKKLSKIVLIAKSNLLSLYCKVGFQVLGKSAIVHGQDPWYDLCLSKQLKCYVVDAFAIPSSKHRSGNPAAVVLMNSCFRSSNDELDIVTWIQEVAKEFNHAETAFVWPKATTTSTNTQNEWYIRYYTKSGAHVSLCGHATLAAAAVLAKIYSLQETITFHAKECILYASYSKEDKDGIWIHMDLPIHSIEELSKESNAVAYHKTLSMLQHSLQLQISDILFSGQTLSEDIMIEVSQSTFQTLPKMEDINYSFMNSSEVPYSRGISISCCGDTSCNSTGNHADFYSRFFGPKVGILEDGVTGSAHAYLAPYYSKKLSKNELVANQMSTRGGLLHCSVTHDKVGIDGLASFFLSGELLYQKE